MAASMLPMILLSLTLVSYSFAFITPSWTHHHHHHQHRQTSVSPNNMIKLGGGGNTNDDGFPRDVKEAITLCRGAVQEALQKRMSRMDIEFPVGTKFGVEKDKVKKKISKEEVTKVQLDTSDRELARLFVDMFQPLGGDAISVIFNDINGSELAKKKWKGDPTAQCRVLALNRNKKSAGAAKQKKKKAMGFAAKLAAEVEENNADSPGSGGAFVLPDKTELAIFVAPGPKELVIVEKICNQVGDATLVILLNARLSRQTNFGSDDARQLFLNEFKPVFNLGAAAKQDDAPGILIFRKFPDDWMIARKPQVGQPKLLIKQADRPTSEDCKAAYDSIEISDVEKGVENILDNVAGWFR